MKFYVGYTLHGRKEVEAKDEDEAKEKVEEMIDAVKDLPGTIDYDVDYIEEGK